MYIKGFRAQTREFEQSILSTGKKRNQANSLNINELKKSFGKIRFEGSAQKVWQKNALWNP